MSRRRIVLGGLACGVIALGAGCRAGIGAGASPDATSVFDAFSPPTPAEAATMAADPFNPDRRQAGMLLLANAPFGGERVYMRLYEIGLGDDDTGVQTVAVKALALHGGPEHVPAIVGKLEQEDDNVLRWEATRALQRLHNPEVAVVPLIEHVSIEDEERADVRSAAAVALGQYREPRVFDALVAALDDPSLGVTVASRRSLRLITGQRFGTDPNEWLDWADGRPDLFADARVYQYPVFERDRRIAEWIVPWLEPPNEIKAAPAGMTGTARRVDEG